jgi:CheY-like chemotaxis protein
MPFTWGLRRQNDQVSTSSELPMRVVIVAEDEPFILMAIAELLTYEGFKIIAARHADEALAILTRDAEGVHLLFTDVRMPGVMDGMALSHHVKANWPWIGILLASAHITPLAEHLPPGCRFLRKPYHHAHVVNHLRELAAAA